jgi:hypothetical protein
MQLGLGDLVHSAHQRKGADLSAWFFFLIYFSKGVDDLSLFKKNKGKRHLASKHQRGGQQIDLRDFFT